MGISKVSNRWLNRTYKCIAIFLVIFAVLISALRLFLPYAHNYREDLQDYINTTYQSDIVIGALNMGWQSSGPTLQAENVSLLQTDGSEVYIQAFDINIDFWKSIRFRRIITKDFTLDGVKVLFDDKVLANNANSEQNATLINSVTELFLKQIGRFSVKNSQVIYRKGKSKHTFLISQIDWLNQGKSHQAHGNVIVDGLTSNNLQVKLDLQGEKLADMKGVIHLDANRLNITPWLDQVLAIDNENTHSTVNFNAWLSIDKGIAKKLQVVLGNNQIAWQHQENIRTLNIDQGQILFQHLDSLEKLQITSSDIQVSSNEQTWAPLNFDIKKVNKETHGFISTVDIAGLADLLPLVIEKTDVNLLIDELDPVGTINDVYFKFANDKLSTVAQFSDYSSQYSNGIPAIENVTGEIIYSDQQLQVDFNASDGALNFDKHFKAPIVYQHLASTITMKFVENSWQLTSDNISFASDEIKLNAEIGVFSEPDKDIELSLLATAFDGNAIYAQSFYPHLLMGEDLVDYLNGALQQGKLEQALVLIQGQLNSFPYPKNKGTFIVDAELVGSTFKFDPNWPSINHFNANLNFTNNSMMITGREGLLSGIDVKGVTAAITDLTQNSVLAVEAKFKETAPGLVTNLMITSPLNESVGAVLEKVVISKNIAGKFSLSLPLDNPDLTVAQGEIAFNQNKIALQAPEMNFTQVNGLLSFENEKVNTQQLKLMWRNMPLTLDVNTYDKEEHYQTDININAQWQNKEWLAQLPELLKPYGDGSLDWQGALEIKNFHDGQFSYQLNIQSDLLQTQLNLPAPFDKKVNQNKLASAKVYGNQDQSRIDVKIGDSLNFYGNLNHQLAAFTQSHLILGDEEMYLPMNGFHITTNLDEAKFEQWQPFVGKIIDSIPAADTTDSSPGLLEKPQRIRGNIGKLTFLDEAIHGVSFKLEDELSWWLLELTSKEARAKVKFYPDWHTQGLDVNADFIHLAPEKLLFAKSKISDGEVEIAETTQTNEQAAPFDIHVNDEFFKNVPPLQVRCASCSYGNLNLGSVNFILERKRDDLLVVNNFVSQRKDNKLSLNAQWQHDQKTSKTTVTGDLNSKDIERELERLGISSTVKDSGLKSNFNVNWFGGPQDFTLASVSGDIRGELDEGYLAEVPDQARAFSILSLQSLVRKLKFDFRDIFSDGMFYSKVTGDFHLQDGIIYTKNTFLKGSAGDLTVSGNTDLINEALDYRMSYKPNVTSSLPAIAWIATLNPVTFLAGIAIDEVITSQVVSEYKFEVTGLISEPSFKVVDRKTQNISVGRDSPPQVVENIPTLEQETLNVPPQEHKIINEQKPNSQENKSG
ncbi:YhdP family protein [Colwellia sp. 1_MG-2023]|uniref:YhdP family protein n=1 Tax=Colwellia sp. 1_MG-2023 TaxID=3062649 RepID=UPI0026E25E66|nr:YhdP family protein [Colwellia sp. 1_MG-2023]MDO6444723.1 YhdP family protein [Colwellia sp. 1_MG-2023]